MITSLTTEQKKLKSTVKQEWLDKFMCNKIDVEKLKKGIRFIYTRFKNKQPRIYIAVSPRAAIHLAHKLGNRTVTNIHYCGLGYDSGWISFYDYFEHIGVVKSQNFKDYKELISCGAFGYIVFENAVIAVQAPIEIHRDAAHRLHAESGPALRFSDGFSLYRWHGTRVPKELILHPESITKEFIEKEENSEVQRAIAEKLGWNTYLTFIDVNLIHKWFDETTSCHYELYDFKKRTGELQPRLLKMESPELNDGTRPYYIEPVPPESLTCQAARRWQCDPSRPHIQECNKLSGLIFEIER